MKRRIAVLTGTRAEYGILRPVLKAISSDDRLQLQLLVTGMHLSDEFGSTVKEIKADGFRIDARIDTLNSEDTGAGMARYIAETIKELSRELEILKPHLLLLLGDRAEMLAAAVTATCMNIPIAHLHGGETSGSVDESFRHAITRMAHIHLAATDEARENLIKSGEDPQRIFVVGAPGLDEINEDTVPCPEIRGKYSLDPDEPFALMVQHPVVTEVDEAEEQIKITLDVLAELEIETVIVYPNADAGGRRMIGVIDDYVKRYPFMKAYRSIPRHEYLSLMKCASFLIGNSSSGIIEAPSFNLPVINIGTRQKGRLRAPNVVDVNHDRKEIKDAVKKVLRSGRVEVTNPWGDGRASERIIEILRSIRIDENLIQK